MALSKRSMALAAALLLAGCEARIGKDAAGPEAEASGRASSAEAKAEDGQLSVDTPGLQMKLDIPAALADRAEVDSDSGVLYPGATLRGMHVEGGRGKDDGMVELRFTSSDDVPKIAAWYRDPARAAKFTVAQASQSGGIFTATGVDTEDGDRFDLSLSPRAGGGSEGRLRLRDKG